MKKAAFRRIFEIDRMIRQGKLISAQKAAWHFGVTKRTIERDFEELRYELGATLIYNRKLGRYEYLGDPITLPAQWLNKQELTILLVAERALRMFTEASFHEEIHPAFNKLLNPVRHDLKIMKHIREICNSIYFCQSTNNCSPSPQQFSTILNAIIIRKRISFSHHEIEPYALVNNDSKWYLLGFCKKSRKAKYFSLSDIQNLKIIEHYFTIPQDFKVDNYFYTNGNQPHPKLLSTTTP